MCLCLLLFAPDLCPEGSLWRSIYNLWDREYAGPSGWWSWTALRGYVGSLKGLTSKWKLIGKMQLWSPAFPDDARCSPPVCDRLLASGTREVQLHPVTAWRRDWPHIRCLSSLDRSDKTWESEDVMMILTDLFNKILLQMQATEWAQIITWQQFAATIPRWWTCRHEISQIFLLDPQWL